MLSRPCSRGRARQLRGGGGRASSTSRRSSGVSALGALAFLLTNLVTDVAYAVADPRIRLHELDPRSPSRRTPSRRPAPASAGDDRRGAGAGADRADRHGRVGLVAITAAVWSPYDPLEPVAHRLEPPSGAPRLGTDALGRDVFTRDAVGRCASRCRSPPRWYAAAVILGTIVGAVAGFFGGWSDAFLMRLVDITMAFPPIFLAMAVTASLGPGLATR